MIIEALLKEVANTASREIVKYGIEGLKRKLSPAQETTKIIKNRSLDGIRSLNKEFKVPMHPSFEVPSEQVIVKANAHGVKYKEYLARFHGEPKRIIGADFGKHVVFETKLPETLQKSTDYRRFCNNVLKEKMEINPKLREVFSERQLETLRLGKNPEGHHWHHAIETGKMQLVPEAIHDKIAHQGGNMLWGSKSLTNEISFSGLIGA